MLIWLIVFIRALGPGAAATVPLPNPTKPQESCTCNCCTTKEGCCCHESYYNTIMVWQYDTACLAAVWCRDVTKHCTAVPCSCRLLICSWSLACSKPLGLTLEDSSVEERLLVLTAHCGECLRCGIGDCWLWHCLQVSCAADVCSGCSVCTLCPTGTCAACTVSLLYAQASH